MTTNLLTDELNERLCTIRHNIERTAVASGRKAEDITLMAVTKTVSPEIVNIVHGLGVKKFGENKAQELCEKYESYNFGKEDIHFIGHLQKNKVRHVIDKVSCIQSVDSVELAMEINKRSANLGLKTDIMVEINIGQEESKAGIKLDEIEQFLEKIGNFEGVFVTGLMAIPPRTEKKVETERYFTQIYEKFVDIRCKNIDNSSMKYLSLGMSADYDLAILHGANLVRVGSGIFGARKLMNK